MIKISILIVLLPHLVYTIVRGTTEIIQESNTNSNNNNNNNYKCGITSYYTDSTNSLIANGEYALPGQWPWVAVVIIDFTSMMYYLPEYGLFLCSGSVLTNRHILTGSTCLQTHGIGGAKNTNHKKFSIIPHNLKVALGQFKLRRFKNGHNYIMGTVNRKVKYITYDSDLAILILRTPVEFSPFIRPICLWSGLTDLENVVDRTGFVVGWAFNESNFRDILVPEPRMLRIPIVNQVTCLRNQQVFHTYTSERTFCAGLLGESGPCYGDHGSGLVLFNNSTGRYHLRGVMSEFLYHNLGSTCNGSKYSVYVDVAQYLSWIDELISTM
ncbi:serine protease gd-like [Temnothorax nylanderi]|uniref:serine protease gd-like n=1 Tax=Temnothorax nylanderi TaxID=102681 RepID=UPI003A85CDB6